MGINHPPLMTRGGWPLNAIVLRWARSSWLIVIIVPRVSAIGPTQIFSGIWRIFSMGATILGWRKREWQFPAVPMGSDLSFSSWNESRTEIGSPNSTLSQKMGWKDWPTCLEAKKSYPRLEGAIPFLGEVPCGTDFEKGLPMVYKRADDVCWRVISNLTLMENHYCWILSPKPRAFASSATLSLAF